MKMTMSALDRSFQLLQTTRLDSAQNPSQFKLSWRSSYKVTDYTAVATDRACKCSGAESLQEMKSVTAAML